LGSGNKLSSTDERITEHWAELLSGKKEDGNAHIANLPQADRVVDVIFGILAKETNRIAYFEHEIEDRQDVDQVKTVYTSLKTIHKIPTVAKTGKSVMKKTGATGDTKAAKSLI
jgi:hypothetical protein